MHVYVCVVYIYMYKSQEKPLKVNMSCLKNKILGQKELISELYAMLKR